MTHSTNNIRSCSRSRNTHYYIFITNITLYQLLPSFFKIILCIFYRITKCMFTTSNKTNHQRVRHTKSWRNFRCIKHTKTSTCASTHIKNTTTLFHTRHNFRNQFLNSRQRLLYCKRNFLILLIHVVQKLAYTHLVKITIKRTFFSYFFKSHILLQFIPDYKILTPYPTLINYYDSSQAPQSDFA